VCVREPVTVTTMCGQAKGYKGLSYNHWTSE